MRIYTCVGDIPGIPLGTVGVNYDVKHIVTQPRVLFLSAKSSQFRAALGSWARFKLGLSFKHVSIWVYVVVFLWFRYI